MNEDSFFISDLLAEKLNLSSEEKNKNDIIISFTLSNKQISGKLVKLTLKDKKIISLKTILSKSSITDFLTKNIDLVSIAFKDQTIISQNCSGATKKITHIDEEHIFLKLILEL